MAEERVRYSDNDLAEFKQVILKKLQQENEQLRTENKSLKSAAETFKKVLHTIGKKFGLQKEVNEELIKSQTAEQEKTVPTRNNNSHDDHDGR